MVRKNLRLMRSRLSALLWLLFVFAFVLFLLEQKLFVSLSAIKYLALNYSKWILQLSFRFLKISATIFRVELDFNEYIGERQDSFRDSEFYHVSWSIKVIYVREVNHFKVSLFYKPLSLIIINLDFVVRLWESDYESVLSEERGIINYKVVLIIFTALSIHSLNGHDCG